MTMASRAVLALLLLLSPSAAFRAGSADGNLAVELAAASSEQSAAAKQQQAQAAAAQAELELLRDGMDSERVRGCPCWNPFNSLTPDSCCKRTDAGSLNWKKDEGATCGTQPVIEGVTDPVEECGSYCTVNCWRIDHKDDKQGMLSYLGEKVGEVTKMGIADILLGRAVWQANTFSIGEQQAFIRVAGIHPIHPVGGWREDTWVKTQGRKNSVLAAKEIIKSKGYKLTVEDMNTQEVLKPMRSVTPFIAVRFPFCGYEYVLLEGNGRLKGMQLAAAEDPELRDMEVEATLLSFTGERLGKVQEGISLLWNQYVKEALEMDPVKDGAQIIEYNTFRVGVARCRGVSHGWFGGTGSCPIVDDAGKEIDTVAPDTLFGTSKMKVVGQEWDFKLCDRSGWVASKEPGVVEEFCQSCVTRQ